MTEVPVLSPITSIVASVLILPPTAPPEAVPRRDPSVRARVRGMDDFERRCREAARAPTAGDSESRLFRAAMTALLGQRPVSLPSVLVALRELEFSPVCVYCWGGHHAAVILQFMAHTDDTSTALPPLRCTPTVANNSYS